MKKIILLLVLIFNFLFVGCVSQPLLQYDKNKLLFSLGEKSIKVTTNGQYTYKRFSSRLNDAYTIEDNNFHLEYISIDMNSTWTGAPESHYIYFLNSEMKGLKKTSHIALQNGDIYKYIKNDRYFYLISLWDATKNIFILDYNGKVASKFTNTDLTIYKENQLRKEHRLQKSLLDNHFGGYFESNNSSEELIILPL